MFISSLAITVFSPQQLITPDLDGCEPGLATAPGVSTLWHLSSIPFSETRGYVKNVLAYDAYYRYFMGDKPTLMSATEWGRRY